MEEVSASNVRWVSGRWIDGRRAGSIKRVADEEEEQVNRPFADFFEAHGLDTGLTIERECDDLNCICHVVIKKKTQDESSF